MRASDTLRLTHLRTSHSRPHGRHLCISHSRPHGRHLRTSHLRPHGRHLRISHSRPHGRRLRTSHLRPHGRPSRPHHATAACGDTSCAGVCGLWHCGIAGSCVRRGGGVLYAAACGLRVCAWAVGVRSCSRGVRRYVMRRGVRPVTLWYRGGSYVGRGGGVLYAAACGFRVCAWDAETGECGRGVCRYGHAPGRAACAPRIGGRCVRRGGSVCVR